ncbi:MAG: hypothetical protein ACK56L_13965, partial [Pseudanabaena sp.]
IGIFPYANFQWLDCGYFHDRADFVNAHLRQAFTKPVLRFVPPSTVQTSTRVLLASRFFKATITIF